jgi:hypothetical protein
MLLPLADCCRPARRWVRQRRNPEPLPRGGTACSWVLGGGHDAGQAVESTHRNIATVLRTNEIIGAEMSQDEGKPSKPEGEGYHHELPKPGKPQTIKTPLALFACAIFASETVLAVAAANGSGTEQVILVSGMVITLLFALAATTVFAWRGWQGLYGPETNPTTFPLEVETISGARIFCGSSARDFERFQATKDEAILKNKFRSVTCRNQLTSTDFEAELSAKKFDIVHIAVTVDKATGDLVFSDEDRLPSDAAAQLLEMCGARLLVLASCDSVPLAARIVRGCNMIAAYEVLKTPIFFPWAEAFYEFLKKHRTLSDSFEYARCRVGGIPMALFLRKDFRIE